MIIIVGADGTIVDVLVTTWLWDQQSLYELHNNKSLPGYKKNNYLKGATNTILIN